jgi:hypothetical protein
MEYAVLSIWMEYAWFHSISNAIQNWFEESACLCELPFGQDVIMSLPDPLDSHGRGEEAICDAEDGKNDDENQHQGKARL